MCQMCGDLEASGAHSLCPQQSRAVRGTHEWACHDAGKAHSLSFGRKFDEFFRVHPPVDRMMQGRGAQILREREKITAGFMKVTHGLDDLFAGFTHTKNQIRFGDHSAIVGALDHRERTLVTESRANFLKDSRDSFKVVGKNLGCSFNDHVDGLVGATEIIDEQFNTSTWALGTDLARCLSVEPCCAIGKVISGDTRDGCIAKSHLCDRFSDTSWLIAVVFCGAAGGDIAKIAAAGADRSAEQEGCLAVFPAFVNIGAAGLCAHRMQPCAACKRTHVLVVLTRASGCANPFRLVLDGGLCVANFNAQQLASFGIRQGAHCVGPSDCDSGEAVGANVPAGASSQ